MVILGNLSVIGGKCFHREGIGLFQLFIFIQESSIKSAKNRCARFADFVSGNCLLWAIRVNGLG